jgi:hypothetical protein
MKALPIIYVTLLAVAAAACSDGSDDPTGVDLGVASAAKAGAARVMNDSDAGPGSFREAVDMANSDPSVTVIQFANGIGTIELATSVIYTGTQPLRIDGRGAVIDGPDNGDGFAANGGGDLTLRRLTFRNAYGNGVFVEVPAAANGMLKVSLEDVTLETNGLHGLHIDDQVDDINDTGSDSDAGVHLSMASSIVAGNGLRPDISDYDGVRVDEGGVGDLVVTVHKSSYWGNYGDGLEVDERGDGDVHADVRHSDFDDNGDQPQNPDDLEDGFDIDEGEAGSIYARLVHVTAKDNEDEGIDFDEEGTGDIRTTMNQVTATENKDENIQFTEDEEELAGGSIYARFNNVTANASRDGDGIKLEEFAAGDLTLQVVNSAVNYNADDGFQLEQGLPGDGSARLQRVAIEGNADDAINHDNVDVVQIPPTT